MSSRPVLASLAAFISAGLRPATPLARAIVIVLAAKFIAVVAMTVFLFVADQNAVVDAATVGRLLGPASLP
jgi:amino acid transporter